MRLQLVGVAILSAAAASGGIEHTILHGVSVGRVRAWVGPEAIPDFSTERLHAIAASRLSEAGIPVRDGGQAALTLAVEVHNDSGTCFVTIEGKLIESAKLERNGMSVAAASWHDGASVIAAVPECAGHTTRAVESVLGDFIETYRAMNPGRVGGE